MSPPIVGGQTAGLWMISGRWAPAPLRYQAQGYVGCQKQAHHGCSRVQPDLQTHLDHEDVLPVTSLFQTTSGSRDKQMDTLDMDIWPTTILNSINVSLLI